LLHWGRRSKLHSGRTRRSAPTGETVALKRGRWVEGAKADRNVGRRLGDLPHNNSVPHSKAEKGYEANHRQDCRCGKPGGLLHMSCRCGKAGGLLHWGRRKGFGSPGRVGSVLLCRRDRRHGKPGGLLHEECRPQTRTSAPQREHAPQDSAAGLETCPTITAFPIARRKKGYEVNHRQDRRHGKPGGLLHL